MTAMRYGWISAPDRLHGAESVMQTASSGDKDQPMASATERSRPVDRIPEIEGLRAVLSWWVVSGHCLGSSGYRQDTLPLALSIVRDAGYAVSVFVIVSGFVIFQLLDSRREGYAKFIVKRFFRLYPLFAVTAVAGLLLLGAERLHYLDWERYYPPGAPIVELERLDSINRNLGWHVLAHLPMLHGVIPEGLLPSAPTAIDGPSWSISLEWQFYLVAPFLFVLAELKKTRWNCILVLTTVAAAAVARKYPGYIELGAFLPYQLKYFFVGAVSQRIYRTLSTNENFATLWRKHLAQAAPVMLALLVMFFREVGRSVFPLLIWLGVFMVIVSRRTLADSPLTSLGSRILCHPVLQWLGKVSYSTYLVHWLVIVASSYFLAAVVHDASQKNYCLLLFLTVVPCVAAVSAATFHGVEAPGIRMGSRVAKWIRRQEA